MAKRRDLPYQQGNREGMQKIKMYRTADCVIGGFRYGERPPSAGKRLVGSLLLGLYDGEGSLHHVGFTSSIKAADKSDLTDKLEKIRAERSFTRNAPGAPSRWSTKRSAEWIPVRPKFVVEVSYDHFSGGRSATARRLSAGGLTKSRGNARRNSSRRPAKASGFRQSASPRR